MGQLKQSKVLRRFVVRTSSGKTWRVLAKQRGTLHNIGDGTLKRRAQ